MTSIWFSFLAKGIQRKILMLHPYICWINHHRPQCKDRRQLNRSGVRRNLDIEDSGHRSGGSRDGKSPCQADGDNKSVSFPFSRASHFSSSHGSLLPPPPPSKWGDGPLALSSFEDDNRSKPNNRHRRIGDPSMGRAQGSPWRGVPNWPSPVPNGFIPFQCGPPQVGFHPVMQQFSAPPMFNLRPPLMEMNQSGVRYHVTDGDRFSGHGRPLGWQNLVDDPIHGWDASNAVIGDESHVYGRPNWDHNSRTITGGQVWETSSGAMWNGYNSGAGTELPSAPDRGGYSARGQADEVWPGQSGLKAQSNEKHPSAQVESIDVDQSNDFVENSPLETPKTIPDEISNLSRNEGACLSHLYLSMLEISPELTQPELYGQYTNLAGMAHITVSEEEDSKFLLGEVKMEDMGATANLSGRGSSASLFPTFNNVVLQKAMSLYKKTREEVRAINGLFSNMENLVTAIALDHEGSHSTDKPGDMANHDQQEAIVSLALNKVKVETSTEITADKIDEPAQGDIREKLEAANAVLKKVKMELDLVSKQQGTVDSNAKDKSCSPKNVETFDAHSLHKVEKVNEASDSKGKHSVTNDVMCGLSFFSDVSNEALMPELVMSESVNLSQIHQSPESTH